jgi:integrase
VASATKYTWTSAGVKRTAWRAVWTRADGGQGTKRGFDREGDAKGYAADRETEIRHGVTITGERPSSRTTVQVWAHTWLDQVEVRPSTAKAYRYAVERINATLGGRSLAGLRPSELKAWRKALGQRYAATTAQQTAAVLAMILRAAVNDGLIPRTPMPPSSGGKAQRVLDPAELLTLDQVRAWDAQLPTHAQGMAIVAAMTGLRQGELLGLRAIDVDFLRGVVRVGQQLVEAPGRPAYGPPKTAAGVRTVPLPTIAGEMLAEHMRLFPSPAGEPLFLTKRGSRWRRSAFQACWSKAKKDASLPAWAHWHALRDVAASSLIYSGTDVRTVMAILGHASSEETLRTYARLWPDAREGARKALDRVWAVKSADHSLTTEG